MIVGLVTKLVVESGGTVGFCVKVKEDKAQTAPIVRIIMIIAITIFDIVFKVFSPPI
jgi:hypothetical protein